MVLRWEEPKDPNEIIDYQLDWKSKLDGDVISGSVWTVPTGIDLVQDTHVADKTSIWLSGGTHGMRYKFTNQVTTQGGRVLEQSVTLLVADK